MMPILRNGTYHMRRRVPRRYARVEPRSEVWISLKTDSEQEARDKASATWRETLAGWEAKLRGETDDAERRFEAARDLAQARGFRYLPVAHVAQLPLPDLLARVEAIRVDRRGRADLRDGEAVLGAVPQPKITVSRALELYWTLARDKTLGKSQDQIRRWENPRKKAILNFVKVCGDLPIDQLSADDMNDFSGWWLDRIENEGLTANSANKDFTHLSTVLRTVNRKKRLGLILPLTDLAIREGDKGTRPPFSTAWIREKLLAPGALAGLNKEARCILLGMVNTGYRPSEGANLLAHHIRLDTEIPHVSIEPEGRTLKSQYSKRVIPLAGVSLEAFRECPEGFPRYRDKPGLSATVNKFLAENGLKETPQHTLYSLRHSFEDRMLAAEVDERIRRDLFGHTLNRERYGQGASLEHKMRIVKRIAL